MGRRLRTVIAVGNQKGGVGKTTNAVHVAAALGERGYRCLVIDLDPSAGATTTVAAYSSADWFLLSVFPHPLSLSGLNEALKDIADVRQRRNPELEILGVILSCVDTRTRMAAELESVVAQSLPGRAFQTVVTQAIALPECSGKGKPLFQLKQFAEHRGVAQYRRLGGEVEQRGHQRAAVPNGRRAT